jgi:glycosyltransferase involved in cell wall biosynthesis
MQAELERVESGAAPTDRMYGLVELRRSGHDVHFSDSRFGGRFGKARKQVRPFVNLPDLDAVRHLDRDDVVVVKDEFSSALTAACLARGTKIVYLDALFRLPRRFWRKASARFNLPMAHGHVVYSREQIAVWAERYGLPESRFTFLPYCIDMSFYQAAPRREGVTPYVLSVGRDTGRSFDTLATAMQGMGLDLKLVTLPYTLRTVDTSQPWIEVLQHVPYADLFRLYADALMVVIPLKGGITYPSGIRGLLEALRLGRAVVSTRTAVLEEYVPEGQGVLYVAPDSPAELRAAIARLRDDREQRMRLELAGPAFVSGRYDMSTFASGLERYLTSVVKT